MLIKISERATEEDMLPRSGSVSDSLQLNCSNSRFKAAGRTDADNPHARCSLGTNFHEGCDYACVASQPEWPYVFLIDPFGDLLLHLFIGLQVIFRTDFHILLASSSDPVIYFGYLSARLFT